MAAVEDASLEALVSGAVEQAVAARRADLERLVRSRIDVALKELAGEVLDQQLSRRCTNCGGFPVLANRTLCRDCHRARSRELHHVRVARRRNGDAAGADEEPEPVPARDEQPEQVRTRNPGGANGAGRAGERLGSPESHREPAARVSGCREPEHVEDHGAGISADELARRTGRNGVLALRADELEAWLRDAGLAQVTSAGLLVPTERGVEIANALAS